MSLIKAIFMYVLALIVLLAPAILLGWIGFSLFGWWAGLLGILGGMLIFAYSINKIAAQDGAVDENEGAPLEVVTHDRP